MASQELSAFTWHRNRWCLAPHRYRKSCLPLALNFLHLSSLKVAPKLNATSAFQRKYFFYFPVAHSKHLAMEVDRGIAIVSPNLQLVSHLHG